MSLHYGVSNYTYKTEKKQLINYQILYLGLSKTQNTEPIFLRNGVPINPRLYCKGHHPDAGFRILTHRFDKDDHLVSPLTLRFKIRIALSDGTVQLINIGDLDYFGSDIERVERSFFVGKTFKFKDINKLKVGNRDIYAFDIVFEQITGNSDYDNESIMDIVVDY